MNIRKFIAPTVRQALRDIRNELGEEAVILSNRKFEQGVEIIALANDEIMQVTGSVVRDSVQNARSHDQRAYSSSLAAESSIIGEIKAMHNVLQQQLAALSRKAEEPRDPGAADLLCRMMNAGFSAQLARQLRDRMPAEKAQRESWIHRILKRNLRVAGEQDDIVSKGGVYALIGPTGVGKTTTTAKLAARAVVRHGADNVALLTTDSYRIGAHEQLKIYGKILGVAVYAVKGTEDLRLTISSLRDKHLVLIDTVGMGQRDDRVGEQREMFDAVSVPRLLLLNSASGGDSLDDMVRMYNCDKVIGCIPTKIDEAVHIGAVLDVVVRHRLVMHYMTNGQCVPEDLHSINLDYLLHRALKPLEKETPFTLYETEFQSFMAGASREPAISSNSLISGSASTGINVPNNAPFVQRMDASYAL